MESRNCYELVSPLAPNTFDKDLGWYERLQLTKPLAAADCHRLNTYLEQQPETLLRIYPQKETGSIGYGFLGRLPALRNLWLEANSGELIDLSGLSELPKRLKTLTLDTVASYSDPKLDRPKRSVEVLEMLTELEEFSFCGRLKDLRFLRGLGGLRELSLWRNKLVSLVGIEACTELRDLEITASGIKELDPVQSLVTLEFLEISRHSQLSKLEPIVRLPKLRQLRLLGCKINGDIPSMHELTSLRVLVIDKLTKVDDLSRIAAAPALRCLVLGGTSALAADSLAPLAGHPCLEEVRLETFDERLYSEIRARYGWKVAYCNYPADEYLN